MKNVNVFRELLTFSGVVQCKTINTLIICGLFVGVIVAQQDSRSAASVQRSDDGAAMAQPPGAESAVSSSPGQQLQSPLPDAASTAKPAFATASSLTLGERFRIYRQAIFRPYSVVGPALGAGIGQWEDEPPEWGQGAQGYGRRIASGMGRQLDLRDDSIWLCRR